MKLLQVHIENFRILKELDLKFSTDKGKPLTVIRAANQSGKTNFLNALQWCFYGDDVLPKDDNRRTIRLSPRDMSTDEEKTVEISVEIDCEIPTKTSIKTYRLIRFATETIRNTEYSLNNSEFKLFEVTAHGTNPINNPQAHINPYLPKELREVFFTDGDRALNFIEGKGSDKEKRVEGAIRSLLGLDVVQKALEHTDSVVKLLRSSVKGGSDTKLKELKESLKEEQGKESGAKTAFETEKKNSKTLKEQEEEQEKLLSEALLKGNREELELRRQQAISQKKTALKYADIAAKDNTELFKHKFLGKQLLANHFKKANTILSNLEKEGKIPSQTIPVLEDQLNKENCICGESLNPKEAEGKIRRDKIQELIKDSKDSDATRKLSTALFYSSKGLLTQVPEEDWAELYKTIFKKRKQSFDIAKQSGELESQLDALIQNLPDVDIRQIKTQRDHFHRKYMESESKKIRLENTYNTTIGRISSLESDIDTLIRKDNKNKKIHSEITVAKDLKQIIESALKELKEVELLKVGEKMNEFFLNMTGADSGQTFGITKAEITNDFKITVWSGKHEVNTSYDLSGAQRRALTISFILALTKVSEVTAPNVIDTPLGMSSGPVKKSILKIAALNSSQLILFLTHDEITGCEEIIDEYAGSIYTMTNPALFPKFLKNKPPVNEQQSIICECNHRNSCMICEFKSDVDFSNFSLE